jgi:hypothetical protein
MKYLSSEPFSIAVRTPKQRGPFDFVNDLEYTRRAETRAKIAGRPHEFVGSVMCIYCSLDSKAAIHNMVDLDSCHQGSSE